MQRPGSHGRRHNTRLDTRGFAPHTPRNLVDRWSFCRAAVVLVALAAACSSSPSYPKLPVTFPQGFRLGVGTVAHQSEGTIQKNGAIAQSNWSQWEDMGKIAEGQQNLRGNGFFDRYDTDLDLAAGIGANAFSYALDWARIEPQPGVFDPDEAARAVSIITDMQQRGLRPMVILFHWVTPTWVQSPVTGVDMLAAPDTSFVDAFVPFVDYMVPKLAAMVDDWVTFEEPISIIGGEYLAGEHPPGKMLDIPDATNALKNLIYLNARAYQHVHQLDTADADGDGVAAWVGFENLAIELLPLHPDDQGDVAATEHVDYIANRQFADAVSTGDIDIDLDEKPDLHDDSVAHTIDFIGLNYYQAARVEAGGAFGSLAPINATPLYDVRLYDPTLPHGDDYAEISASGLRVELEGYAKYGVPLMVTENGMADADDDQRPYYTLQHLYEIGNAIRDGYDVRGYYHWTLSDNFEWQFGRNLKEGLFQVDFSDPGFARKKTRSAELFSKVAEQKGIDQSVWDEYALDQYPAGIP